jgi:predicted AAA+ superfamily ATPase
VLQELRREASGRVDVIDFYHYRDRDGAEVDIVVEQGNQLLAGIEVKAAASVSHADLRGLRKLSALVGDRFKAGVVLYDGASMVSFGDRLYAVPIRALWDPL